VEHTLLAVAGGAAGLLVAVPGVSLMKTLLPAYLPRYAEIGVDIRVLLFTLGLSIVIGIFSGLVAAFSILRTRSFLDMRQSGEQSGVPGRIKKWRSILVFIQTALALTLLSGSGLMLKNFLDKLNTNWGFNPENLLARIFHTVSYRGCASGRRYKARAVRATKAYYTICRGGITSATQ